MLRGFNLPGTFQDQNGCLPDNLHEDVLLRIDDLETSLFDAEDNLDLSGLKKSFSWARFCLRVARFAQRREQEFKDVVASHPRIDDVQDLLIKAIKRQRRPNMAETPSRSILADSVYDSPSITLNATPQERPRAQEKGSKTPLNEMTGSREADRTALSPHVATPRSDPKPTTSELKGANRRKSGKGIWRNPDGMDMLSFLAKNIQSGRQAEKAPSQPPPTRTPQGEHSARPESPLGLGITADKDEIAGTPEPELEPEPASHQPVSTQRPETSRQRPESSHSKDEHTLHRSYYDFEISQPNQEDMSASPRGSERINRVSHRPSPFFASPSVARGKQAWPHRSLLDPQPTASKIFFSPGDSEEDSHLNQRHREPSKRPSTQNPPASQSHSRKRGRGDSDDDSSDDDDFDRDTRTHDVSARRAQISTRTHHGEKRQRLDVETQRGSVELLEATTASQSSPRSQQARSANQEASSTQPPRKESRWLAENSLPSTTDLPSLSTYPAYKGRRRWSDEEDERLLMLVARYGTQWAVIQRQDQICPASEGGSKLGNRTQVNMKDRARTLKKYYIRCGLPLPLNFDHVTG
ncbi:hypothetical protein POX_g08844 [Penicillium oxalicum]|uniref:hypothetical protein n=1 Tax=Penicillium oxalicum TaxID=69781 RepID=UPI0020B7C712|nr:hypothetical protein POX_g08844 [Penicillium oxalicum]KAI2786458.1 hypothetical protein POX_g08844 [Penicillium oxalicum]